MQYQNILLAREGVTAVVTLNRPNRRNALSRQMMQELIDCLEGIGKGREIRTVILAAAGQVFCSGHDLSEMTGCAVGEYRELFELCTKLMETIQSIPQPVIAEVQGTATAAGCQLVATCDLAIASVNAKFATPGVRIGLFCSTPMVALSRAVGRKKAMEMLLTGEPISAEEALAAGLVNTLAPAEQLAATTLALAARIAASSHFVVGIGKQAFYQQIDMPQQHAYGFAREVMSANALAADAQEGMGAFLEKRRPRWLER